LWMELDKLSNIHNITWIKVKGHSDDEYNSRCDKLATGEIKKHGGKVSSKENVKESNSEEQHREEPQ